MMLYAFNPRVGRQRQVGLVSKSLGQPHLHSFKPAKAISLKKNKQILVNIAFYAMIYKINFCLFLHRVGK